jgi:adenine/guanine phosphoribosyltransferase-like PRPP-binding protein
MVKYIGYFRRLIGRMARRKWTKKAIVRHLRAFNEQTQKAILREKLVFVTTREMLAWCRDWGNSLKGQGFGLLVGVPESGLIVAKELSQFLKVPYVSLLDFDFKDRVKTLVVDDSVSSGKTIRQVKRLLSGQSVQYGALIVNQISKGDVDFFYRVLPTRRLFEWGLGKSAMKIATDLDGVIFNETEKSLIFKSEYPFMAIVTNRLERERDNTTKWLNSHEVKYKRLVMAKAIRDRSVHKTDWILQNKPDVFIESDPVEAKKIARFTKTPILSFEEKVLYA